MNLSQDEIVALTERIQSAGTEVVEAKAGGGSATLSMAYAGYKFASSVLRAMDGESDVVECAYVQSEITKLPFFASRVHLGPEGVAEVLSYGELSAFEKEKLEKEVFDDLEKAINLGTKFVSSL
mmetsp:Transcript_423/g.577  ORF Transcript_423/g.577 Transcript_423/m.577 type:complete len:124 (+) Transcript_423:3-374(+)